jgi:hypothetical protein
MDKPPHDNKILEQLLRCFKKYDQRFTYKLGIKSDYKECRILYLHLLLIQKTKK